MKTTDSKRICAGYEPIPGYVLEEVIGRGGFGEVWRSSAPGGLKKAVKFVFGAHDQSRAERELRSLERIKGVHHPFLLTLERFEAIENQLVIVTELADCSLEDVYKEHRDNGSCGIPRTTLVPNLYDAADALDYLHENYQLQHLDIKPGNLLLVGGHVKVADFGLLKDLRDTDVSVVGGLTPIYAPPELFDGRPNMHSDQYSLAVMYQELLTGTRPFSGRTIAQLATQHVHSAPNLEPLPPADRPVIARALEKNPSQRFSSCKDFVEALKAPQSKPRVSVSGANLDSADVIPTGEPVEDLPQLTASGQDSANAKQQHAFIIALGGAGAECLRDLRQRVASRHGFNALKMSGVLIDTDMASIHSMKVAQVSDQIPSCNTIYTPLRTAQEYRQSGTDRLRTISRRWIYNVPRSGATEGMRPLGRLALVDHGEMVTKQLTEAINELAASAEGTIPLVYVVGSLAGGTCSGMYIDVVHLLRHLMDEAGLVQSKILSLLSATPFQVNPAYPLALHDTQAALVEMCHFLKAGNGYPGDPGAGWSSVPAARTPLKNVYVVSGSTHGSIAPAPSHTITDYIWADMTGSKDLLAAARSLKLDEENTSIAVPSVRSVGVVPLGDNRRLAQKVLAPKVVSELLLQWLGLPSKAKKSAVSLSDRIMRRIGISETAFIRAVESQTGATELRELTNQLVAALDPATRNDQVAVAQALTPVVERMVANGEFQEHTQAVLSNLRRELTVGLNDRKADITTVIEALKRIHKTVWDLANKIRDELQGKERDVTDSSNVQVESAEAIAVRLVASCLLDGLCDHLRLMQERFDRFATTLAMSIVEAQTTQNKDANPWDDLPQAIRSQFQFVVVQLHETAVRRFLIRPLGDQPTIVEPRSMVSDLIDTAVPFVSEIFDENADLLPPPTSMLTTIDGMASSSLSTSITNDSLAITELTAQIHSVRELNPTNESLTVDQAVVAVKPAMLMFGGRQRLLLTVGSEQERTQLEPQVREAHEGSLTVAVIPGSAPRLIHEAQQISLTDVLSRLSVLNGDNTQVTSRLFSRTDVNWQ